MNNNPFNFSKTAKKGDFYNRKDEIDMAIELTKNLQCFSVVGERRIGKTSFLEYILSEEVLKEHKIDTEKYVIVHLGIDSPYGVTKDEFIGSIIEKIRKITQIEIESKIIYKKFENYVDRLAKDEKNLIIALDEFECIEPILDEDFSPWLKSIFEKKNVMAITASRTTIKEMGRDSKPSPLYGIFHNIFLGIFERKETERMLFEMFLKGGMNLSTETISFLASLSGGNPYLIQVVGFHYYLKRLNRSEFKEMIIDQVKDIFTGYWEHLSEEEKVFLLDIENSKNDGIAYKLRRKGFIMKEDGKWKIFSPLFEEFIATIPRSSQLPQIEEGDTGEEPLQKEETNGRLHNILNILIHNTSNILIGIIAGLIANYVWDYIKSEDGVSLIDFIFFFRDKMSIIIFFVSFLIVFIILKKFQEKRN